MNREYNEAKDKEDIPEAGTVWTASCWLSSAVPYIIIMGVDLKHVSIIILPVQAVRNTVFLEFLRIVWG